MGGSETSCIRPRIEYGAGSEFAEEPFMDRPFERLRTGRLTTNGPCNIEYIH